MNSKYFILFIFALITLFSSSCSLYESDAREFMREQGFEFSATAKANISSLAQKHCFNDESTSLSEGQWETHQSELQTSIHYYDTYFSCTFIKTSPESWSDSDYPLLENIVDHYKNIY